ncbi:MAG TPA: S41 family peptidase [Gemmatimonadaceae bacterium]|nr:S41 family peptidase [Gemmatimonadaceae bacterium]
MLRSTLFVTLLVSSIVQPATAVAQPPRAARDTTIDAATRTQIIDTLIAKLDAGYVFPEKATEMARDLRARLERGAYTNLTSAIGFADSLTAHLQSVSHDKHLRVMYSDRVIPTGQQGPTPEQQQQMRERMKADNYGIGTPERLEGNVAYLELRTFGVPPDMMGEALADAMSKVADADALIIDVRRNGGGSPQTVALVSSYLFGTDTVHLNSLYWRPANRTDHFYTQASVPGKRFGPTKPLFVLTSRRTFSAAEEFTYNLQTRQRAVIVGDTTGGGAHPGGGQRLNDHFGVFVPSGRAINPITKTNWEGTGIRPNVPVPSDSARNVAHRLALEALRRTAQERN